MGTSRRDTVEHVRRRLMPDYLDVVMIFGDGHVELRAIMQIAGSAGLCDRIIWSGQLQTNTILEKRASTQRVRRVRVPRRNARNRASSN
jgi:hypothetical protein